MRYTHIHPFNGPLWGATRVSRYQRGKTNLDFTEARDSEWQWHQLGYMSVCTLLQTDNHASIHHSVCYRPDALPAAQPTASKHWRHTLYEIIASYLSKVAYFTYHNHIWRPGLGWPWSIFDQDIWHQLLLLYNSYTWYNNRQDRQTNRQTHRK